MPGSLYATATMSLDRLIEAAAREDLVLDRRTLGGTGFQAARVPRGLVDPITRQMRPVHASAPAAPDRGRPLCAPAAADAAPGRA